MSAAIANTPLAEYMDESSEQKPTVYLYEARRRQPNPLGSSIVREIQPRTDLKAIQVQVHILINKILSGCINQSMYVCM